MTENANPSLPYYKIIADTAATKPWITMVHGASQYSEIFSAQVRAFRHDYRLLLIDLPGHGKSVATAGPYGLEEYADSVLAAMNHAGVEQAHFWGTHTGAGVGLLLATRHVDRFASLVLEGAVLPGVVLPSVAKNVGRARATLAEKGIEDARIEWFEHAEWFDVIRDNPHQCRAAEHWSMIAEFTGAPWLDSSAARPVGSILDKLSQISVPVLLVNGERDLEDFLQTADQLATILPYVKRVSIPDAGGFPLWEIPTLVNELVGRFLTGQEV